MSLEGIPNYLLNEINSMRGYDFVKFEVNSESVRMVCLTRHDLKDSSIYKNGFIFRVPNSEKRLVFPATIINKNIKSVVIWTDHEIRLQDDKKLLNFHQRELFGNSIKGDEENWTEFIKLLEKQLFPHLVNYLMEEILEKGEIVIGDKVNGLPLYEGLKISQEGIYLKNKFIELGNINAIIDFKKWEVKISNRKRIFQNHKLSTHEDNVIIIPYLIDYLKIIQNQ